MKTTLTIAGSDSGAGAGIQADLKTFVAHGVYGTSVVTAVTAQNSFGISKIHAVPSDIVFAQVEAVMRDLGADSAKTGVLATAANVKAVVTAIERFQIPLVVVDPVIMSHNGDRLLEDEAIVLLKTELFRRAYVVTPNIREAEILLGRSINSPDDVHDAARQIHSLGPAAVIIKGGHLPGPEVIDVLYDGISLMELKCLRVNSLKTHGTGCAFGAAVAANLALGLDLQNSARSAQEYTAQAIRGRIRIGPGYGALNHFWNK